MDRHFFVDTGIRSDSEDGPMDFEVCLDCPFCVYSEIAQEGPNMEYAKYCVLHVLPAFDMPLELHGNIGGRVWAIPIPGQPSQSGSSLVFGVAGVGCQTQQRLVPFYEASNFWKKNASLKLPVPP